MTAAPSPLRPSSAAALVQCHGSARMQAPFPEVGDGQDAREGRAAHWALSEMLRGDIVAEGQLDPEGTMLTAEMIESAKTCFDDIVRTVGPEGLPFVHSERPVSLSRIYPGMWGTPDVRATVTPRLRYVWDFKHGHRYVDPFENWQLLCYALADEYADEDPQTVIVLKIVQPRSFHRSGVVREWRLFSHQLEPYRRALAHAAARAMGPSPTLRTGPACGDCLARHACPVLQAEAYGAAEASGQAVPVELTPSALGLELRNLWRAQERLNARVSGLEAQAEALQRQGVAVPFTVMQNGRGSTVWTVPTDVVIETGRLLGHDLAKPAAAITPKQAEAKGFPEAVLQAYARTVPGALKLCADDTTQARKVFGPQP